MCVYRAPLFIAERKVKAKVTKSVREKDQLGILARSLARPNQLIPPIDR